MYSGDIISSLLSLKTREDNENAKMDLETNKMSTQESIERCELEINDLQVSLSRLKKEFPELRKKYNSLKKLEEEKPRQRKLQFGDIIDCVRGRRVVMVGANGNLYGANKQGFIVSGGGLYVCGDNYYKYTGQNIFEHNLLGLDL